MSDAHENSSENQDEQELEAEGETQEVETEGEGTETEDAGELETETEGEAGGEGETEQTEQRREARGQPSREQRDRRIRDRDEFERAVDRAVQKRLGTQRPAVDPLQQRRDLDERRRRELDEARVMGPEAYADVRDRHLREDYQADQRARDMQIADDREESRFDRLCDRDSIVASVRDQVDERVREMRAQGIHGPLNRELIANDIIARNFRQRAARQGGKQRREAAETTRRQTVRAPANSASQQPANRRRGARNFAELSVDEMEQQLAGVNVRTGSAS